MTEAPLHTCRVSYNRKPTPLADWLTYTLRYSFISFMALSMSLCALNTATFLLQISAHVDSFRRMLSYKSNASSYLRGGRGRGEWEQRRGEGEHRGARRE